MSAALRSLQLLILWLAAIFAGLLLIALPRAVAPLELPALVLDGQAVQAQQQEDARMAAAAPQTQRAESLWAMYLKFGETEVVTLDQPQFLEQRRIALRHARQLLIDESGPVAATAMRAFALSRFEAALAGELPKSELKGILGVFPHALVQHQVTRDGIELAPHFVVRTLYKARWNRMCGLEPEAELSRIEKRAYFGWMGLHAANLSIRERENGLLGYAAAGGAHAEQALGVLAFVDGDFGRAAHSLERAYAKQASLRLRNYLRGAQVAANRLAGPTDAPVPRTAAWQPR